MKQPTQRPSRPPLARETPASYIVSRYRSGRHWAVHAPDGALVCVALYRKGAREVARRLNPPAIQGSEEANRADL